jgi:hypothetical protein
LDILIFRIFYLFISVRKYKKGLEVYVRPPSGMIQDDTEGDKPELGDGAIYFCKDVSSMSCLTYYYHGTYPLRLSLLIKGCFYI